MSQASIFCLERMRGNLETLSESTYIRGNELSEMAKDVWELTFIACLANCSRKALVAQKAVATFSRELARRKIISRAAAARCATSRVGHINFDWFGFETRTTTSLMVANLLAPQLVTFYIE